MAAASGACERIARSKEKSTPFSACRAKTRSSVEGCAAMMDYFPPFTWVCQVYNRLLFGQCQKVTRSPQASGSFALQRRKRKKKQLDYARLLSRAPRAICFANVRSGILPPQSGFRRNDELENTKENPRQTHPHPTLPLKGRAKRASAAPPSIARRRRHPAPRQLLLRLRRAGRVALRFAHVHERLHVARA
jgi:hypothetical protein